MKILIDLNVIVDVILQRQPWLDHQGQFSGYLIAPNLTTLFYLVRRFLSRDEAFKAGRVCLQSFPIFPVDGAWLSQAAGLPGPDFEDNLIIAAAIQGSFDAIVTHDTTGFSTSPVPSLSPADLLAKLSAGNP